MLGHSTLLLGLGALAVQVGAVKEQTALVIGGTGFMGRHVVERLLASGVAVELVSTGHSPNPWGARVPETICDRHQPCLEKKFKEGPWDLVVDFPIFDTGDAGAIVKNAHLIRHYIFPSSDDIYMVCNRTQFQYGSTGGVLENSALRPSNMTLQAELNQWDTYGSNKKHLEETFAESNLNFTALRLPDVWGSYESTGRFVTFLRALEQGKAIGLHIASENPIFATPSSGDVFRPGFVFAEDVAQMVSLLLDAGPQRRPVNVAVDASPSFREVVLESHGILQKVSAQSVGKLAFSDDKGVPLLSTDIGTLDIGRAKALGFQPTPWQQGWQDTIVALLNISRNDSMAADELAKCRKHCDMICYCEPTVGSSHVLYA